ncbi:MAG TPA: hypothetical protein G4O16_00440 [Dehalococcoidia bacterium]|nr:hypothetical protein [Dehalococcoidia bacterium]
MFLLNKPKVEVSVDVDGDSYYLGDTIKTRIHMLSQDKLKVRAGSMELACTEEYWKMVSDGKTTRAQKYKRKLFRLKESFLTSTEFSSGMALNERKSLILPVDIPPTIVGKSANISWQLDVKLDIPKMRDIHKKKTLTVLPIANAIPIGMENDIVVSNRILKPSRDGDITLTLDSSQCTAGVTLCGTLETMIKKDISVEGVRVELEVKEKAGVKSSKTIIDKVQLEEKTHFAVGSYKRWKFSLKIPEGTLPSYKISDTSVQWRVKGIINKRLKKDLQVELPISVY